jgi:hypothetical protein
MSYIFSGNIYNDPMPQSFEQEESMLARWKLGVASSLALMAIAWFVMASGGQAAEPQTKKSDQAGTSCVEPAKGPLATTGGAARVSAPLAVPAIQARVGKPAPDFEANALVDGKFKNVNLSDYKGKWVVLCFYPGDFTFV